MRVKSDSCHQLSIAVLMHWGIIHPGVYCQLLLLLAQKQPASGLVLFIYRNCLPITYAAEQQTIVFFRRILKSNSRNFQSKFSLHVAPTQSLK